MRAAILLVLCLPAFALAQGQVSRAEGAALQRQGYRFYEGRWRLPEEVVYLQRGAAPRLPPTPAVFAPAKAPIVAASSSAARPGWLAPRRRVTSTGLFTLHLQQTQLLGMDTVPVSFGVGQGRLQLPRTESISIGTTVSLPLY